MEDQLTISLEGKKVLKVRNEGESGNRKIVIVFENGIELTIDKNQRAEFRKKD